MTERVVLLDFDDTLSDLNTLMGQYVRELTALLVDEYGGEPALWQSAAADALNEIGQRYREQFTLDPLAPFRAWLPDAKIAVVTTLFRIAGIAAPDNRLEMAENLQRKALLRCDAIYPHVKSALTHLAASGYTLHLASANPSDFLDAALEGAGMEHLFAMRFGPDLIDCAKESQEFFQRIVQALNLSPAAILVIDDHPEVLSWARAIGAKTIQTCLTVPARFEPSPYADAVLTDWSQLPVLLPLR